MAFPYLFSLPTWMSPFAAYGMLNGFTLFGPKLNFDDGDTFPVIAKWEHWSSIVTDKELMNLQRAQG